MTKISVIFVQFIKITRIFNYENLTVVIYIASLLCLRTSILVLVCQIQPPVCSDCIIREYFVVFITSNAKF